MPTSTQYSLRRSPGWIATRSGRGTTATVGAGLEKHLKALYASLPEGKALAQIKAKGYAEKYRSAGKPIHLIGVEFSRQQRQIVAFEVESIT